MKWTDKKPTTPGLYWWRWDRESASEIVGVEIYGTPTRLWASNGLSACNPLSEWGGQWSDAPIPEPEDSK